MSIFSVYTEARGKRRWIDKTPNYTRLLPLLDRIFDSRVLYVLVVRHPFDVVDSLERSPAFAIAEPEDPDIALAVSRFGRTRRGWASHWTEVNSQLDEFRTACAPRCHVVTYETLARQPKTAVSDVCDFLGEDYLDRLVDEAFSISHKEGYGDWKIRSAASVHTASIGKWRQWRRSEIDELWNIVGPTALRFGYEEPSGGIS
jgi:hypothetical protein